MEQSTTVVFLSVDTRKDFEEEKAVELIERLSLVLEWVVSPISNEVSVVFDHAVGEDISDMVISKMSSSRKVRPSFIVNRESGSTTLSTINDYLEGDSGGVLIVVGDRKKNATLEMSTSVKSMLSRGPFIKIYTHLLS
jgi:hypothetical protein